MKFLSKIAWKPIGKIALIVLSGLASLFLLVWGGLWIARSVVYTDYLANKETVCKIPGISKGFVIQGLTNTEDNTYIFTGYLDKTEELVIYLVKDNVAKEIIPVKEDGSRWCGHGGGATVAKNFLYITNEKSEVLMFNLLSLETAKDGDKVQNMSSFNVTTNASFCFAEGNNLYIGEFYRPKVYETNTAHAYTTPSGEEHRAWVCRYALDSEGFVENYTPNQVISIHKQVQGFAVKDGIYMLSSSWGISTSKLDFYQGLVDSNTTVTIDNNEIPLFYLDSSNLIKTLDMPAFSEDLTVIDNRVLVNFESACNKYFIGKLFGANKLISYPIPE